MEIISCTLRKYEQIVTWILEVHASPDAHAHNIRAETTHRLRATTTLCATTTVMLTLTTYVPQQHTGYTNTQHADTYRVVLHTCRLACIAISPVFA